MALMNNSRKEEDRLKNVNGVTDTAIFFDEKKPPAGPPLCRSPSLVDVVLKIRNSNIDPTANLRDRNSANNFSNVATTPNLQPENVNFTILYSLRLIRTATICQGNQVFIIHLIK